MKPPVKKAPKPEVKRARVVKSTLVGEKKTKGAKPRSVASSPAENERLRKNPERPTSWKGGGVVKDKSWGDAAWSRTVQSDRFDFNKDVGPKATGEHRQRVAELARSRAKKLKLPKNGK